MDVKQKIEEFFGMYRTHTYQKSEVLVEAGENPQGVFYLKKGTVRQYALSLEGMEFVVNIFKEGAFFPMSWAINSTANDYYFQAVTDCEVEIAPKDAAVKFVQDDPDVLFDLLSRVYRGTDGLLAKMTQLMSGQANLKLLEELIIHAKRFGKEDSRGVQLELTEKELAAHTGLSRETISRELKDLREKGLIETERNSIVIKRLFDLEKELQDNF